MQHKQTLTQIITIQKKEKITHAQYNHNYKLNSHNLADGNKCKTSDVNMSLYAVLH